ncbi:hypothetical protein CMESO_55 (nucleomorph) [Chroomonas mesostigmatica CCMP1168]|uniref:Uncharacterized protein n=1 Tax=Chroomonas mesostigmatica CCMP1168 TaxID=1195612 RepID=J7G188_9CRYP|nr:hypothetical protein CMESO_55 [Chroomonas mesostigmatica CCMP1168]|mmetsp:Transcript_66791/g.164617  ORF Transcript_66791/g.164617 Transcript_66791/m.164617 type:complete len:209 (+) Transcript_66791:5187-5813(+)
MFFFIFFNFKNLHLTLRKNIFDKTNFNKNNFYCNNLNTDSGVKASIKINSKNIKNYQKFLPDSFLVDKSAPFLVSLLWLQKIGRTDLTKKLNQGESTLTLFSNSSLSFRGDPIFNIQKKIRKKKKQKNNIPLSLGKNIEDKLILFEYKKIKKTKTPNFKSKKKYINNEITRLNFSYSLLELKLVNYSIIQRLVFCVFFLMTAFFSRAL